MTANATQRQAKPQAPCNGPCPPPNADASMMTMCKGMLEKLPSGPWLMLPGVVLVVVGLLIFVQPGVLVWLAGSITILLGILMLAMANFMRRMGARLRNT